MKQQIDALVEHVATKAVATDTPFAEAIDALKAITAYLTMERRRGGGMTDPDPDEPDFGKFRDELDQVEGKPHGGTKVRDRRGAGASRSDPAAS